MNYTPTKGHAGNPKWQSRPAWFTEPPCARLNSLSLSPPSLSLSLFLARVLARPVFVSLRCSSTWRLNCRNDGSSRKSNEQRSQARELAKLIPASRVWFVERGELMGRLRRAKYELMVRGAAPAIRRRGNYARESPPPPPRATLLENLQTGAVGISAKWKGLAVCSWMLVYPLNLRCSDINTVEIHCSRRSRWEKDEKGKEQWGVV